MKAYSFYLFLFMLVGLFKTGAVSAADVRDPFWPIGYAPTPPEKPELEHHEKREPVKPPAPAIKPVTEDDWTQARKTLSINGVTRSTRPDTKETRTLVMINRQLYSTGDSITLVYADIRFQWRLASIDGNAIKLEPLRAERLSQITNDLTQQRQKNN